MSEDGERSEVVPEPLVEERGGGRPPSIDEASADVAALVKEKQSGSAAQASE